MSKYVALGTVKSVVEKVARRWVRGSGEKTEFAEDSQGWYAVFGEWPTSMYLGKEKPNLKVGDKVRLTVEKI